MKGSRARLVWRNMITRCDSKDKRHSSYIKRGIIVCERWKNFENFYKDMGPPPPGLSLERIDNNGNYEPSNCRWATRIDQQRNTTHNRHISFGGKTQLLTDWALEKKLKINTLSMRLDKYGWSIERALTTPVKRNE